MWERSKEWPTSWGCTDAWCAKHWPTQFPENERSPSDPGRNWKQQWLSSRRFWKETEQRHESSGTPRTGSGAGSERRCQKSTLLSPRFVDTFGGGRFNCDWSARRRSFRSPMLGVERRRWTGMKLTRISAESESWPTYFACAAWPAEELSIAPSRTPASKRFWKRTNGRSLIFLEFSKLFVTTTSRVR